ncbi:glycosyltransferase family 4 protein [soil metagenome]
MKSDAKKKVAMVDPSLFTWPYDKALVDGLRAEGHDVLLYTKCLAAKEEGKGVPWVRELFYPGFQTDFVKSLPKSLFLALKGIAHFFSQIALYRRLRRDRPDIIHFQWLPLPVIDRMFVPLFRRLAPVVMTVHDSAPFNNNPTSKLQSMRSSEIMKDFDRLIVHTERSREAMVRHGLTLASITRIEHGLLGSATIGEVAPLALRPVENPVNVLLFGYLKPYKGADLLVEALAQMSEPSRSATRLRIVGKPLMDPEPLQARAKALGVDRLITWDLRFVGDEEIAGMFGESDIMAMPYREIDASGVLMVALAIGRPIVATRIGLFAELLEDGKHGYLVPPEAPAALAEALTRLVENPPMRIRMGHDVRELGHSIPAWDTIARTTDQLYTQLIANRAGA